MSKQAARGLFWGIAFTFSWRRWRKPRKPSGYPIFGSRLKGLTFWQRESSANRSALQKRTRQSERSLHFTQTGWTVWHARDTFLLLSIRILIKDVNLWFIFLQKFFASYIVGIWQLRSTGLLTTQLLILKNCVGSKQILPSYDVQSVHFWTRIAVVPTNAVYLSWRWPHDWPKHASGRCVWKLI